MKKTKQLGLKRTTLVQIDPKRLPVARGGAAECEGIYQSVYVCAPDKRTQTCLSCP